MQIQPAAPLPSMASPIVSTLRHVISRVLVIVLGILFGGVLGGVVSASTLLYSEGVSVAIGMGLGLFVSLFVCTKLKLYSRHVQYFQECFVWLRDKLSYQALNDLKQTWMKEPLVFSSKEQMQKNYLHLLHLNEVVIEKQDVEISSVWRGLLKHMRKYPALCENQSSHFYTSLLLDQLCGDRFHVYSQWSSYAQLQDTYASSLSPLFTLSGVDISSCQGKEMWSLEIEEEEGVMACMVGEMRTFPTQEGEKKVWHIEHLIEDPAMVLLSRSLFAYFWDASRDIAGISVEIGDKAQEQQERYARFGFQKLKSAPSSSTQTWLLPRPR